MNQRALEAGSVGELVHLSAFNAPANHGTVYHLVSLFRRYANADVEEVSAVAFEKPAETIGTDPLETWTAATMTFTNGVTASLEYVSSWAAPLRWGRPRIVTLDGSTGSITSADGLHTLHRREAAGDFSNYRLVMEGPAETPSRWVYPTNPPIAYVNPF